MKTMTEAASVEAELLSSQRFALCHFRLFLLEILMPAKASVVLFHLWSHRFLARIFIFVKFPFIRNFRCYSLDIVD